MQVSPCVKQQMDEILAKEMPPVTQWKAVLDLLLKESLAWKATLEPSMVLVHQLNRSGLGVNGHNCHSKAAGILKAGFDKSYLHSSCCR